MRVTSVDVQRWRNLADLHVDIPQEAPFICLVGENGTGKSSLLELITFAAHHVGLTAQMALRRPVPAAQPGVDLDISVTFATEREDLRARLQERVGEVANEWDGTLTFAARSWSGDEVPEIPPGTSYSTSDRVGGWYLIVSAGGVGIPHAANAGNHIAQALREVPELLHLYIDAERVFPPAEIRDEEVLALARQDTTVPAWLKQQAAQLTQNLYLEWMRSMLGRQQRLQTEYFQKAMAAHRAGQELSPPVDPLENYRAALAQVLPHLQFLRLDQDARRLVFDSSGTPLPYEELSGGERELAFLIGQIDRFGLRDGLFLLDEPELHLNPELLRGWLDYLRSTVGNGQAWVATHSLEAAEIAGPTATLVMERDDDRLVRNIAPIADRPALSTLAAAVGTPAFSVARSRFVLIEGTRERRERERFATVLDAGVADRFIEAEGCLEVIAKVRALRELASAEEQLRVGGIVDQDFRTDEQRRRLRDVDGIHVLSVHEVENLFLEPDLLKTLLRDIERDPDDVLRVLQDAADPDAGRWAFEKTKTEDDWREDARRALGVAATITWGDASHDTNEAARRIAEAIPEIEGAELARRRLAIRRRFDEYSTWRESADRLSASCFGKQALQRTARSLGYRDSSTLESRAAVLWRSGLVRRPPAAAEVRAYLDQIPVLTG